MKKALSLLPWKDAHYITIKSTQRMFTDNEFDTVYFSEYMKEPTSEKDKGLARIYSDLEEILNRHGYKARLLPYRHGKLGFGQLSIWCRDYMPIPVANGKNILFRYKPDYLKSDRYKPYRPDAKRICDTLRIEVIDMSQDNGNGINLDGGNIVRCGDKVVMTRKIFRENKQGEEELTRKLEELFGAKVILLDWDKRECYGHTDGILRYTGGNKIILPTYGNPGKYKKDKEFDKKFRDELSKYFEILPLDFSGIDKSRISPDDKDYRKRDHRWAYINFLQLRDLIIIPEFENTPESNEKAKETIQKYVGDKYTVESVEATDLVRYGGAFNCASWTARADAL